MSKIKLSVAISDRVLSVEDLFAPEVQGAFKV